MYELTLSDGRMARTCFSLRALLIAALAAAALSIPAHARGGGSMILYVDAGATGSANGTSWTSAYNSLQDALAHAADPKSDVTQIWVARGTYMPDGGYAPFDDPGNHTPGSGDRFATFQLINNITLYGGFAGGETSVEHRDSEANTTTLSGDLLNNDAPVNCSIHGSCGSTHGNLCVDGACILYGNADDNAYNVVTGSGTGRSAVLDGFTVRAGRANGAAPHNRGGGIRIAGGSPTIRNCTIQRNYAQQHGGGIATDGGGSPLIIDCIIEMNWVFSGSGGGMYNQGSATVQHCTFRRNRSNSSGGGLYNAGDPNHTLLVTDSTFFANFTAAAGGGARSEGGGTTIPAVFRRCQFLNNFCTNGAGGVDNRDGDPHYYECSFIGNTSGGHGGAINNSNQTVIREPWFVNCLIYNNSANHGGAMFSTAATPRMTNCTIVGNTAPGNNAGGIHNIAPQVTIPTLTNCIVWGNSGAQINAGGVVNYSIFQGGWTGSGGLQVIDQDPLFVDLAGGNLRLALGSPAIDSGNNAAVPLGVTVDLDGNPRFVDDPATPDTGNPGSQGPPIVDMGAYEFQADAGPTCPGDLTGSGNVGVPDLLQLLSCWGPVTPSCAAADLTGNGNVGVPDLLALLSAWGPCP